MRRRPVRRFARHSSSIASSGNLIGNSFASAACGDTATARKLLDEASAMPPAATEDSKRGIRFIDALIRRRQGDAHATANLTPPKDDSETAIIFTHGIVSLSDGNAAAAAAHFKRIHQQPLSTNVLRPVSWLHYGRALAKLGKTDESRTAYDEFLAGWKNVVPTIPILVEAKKEYASLGSQEQRPIH